MKAIPLTRREMLAAPGVWKARPRRPNVLVILSDDQGFGDLSLHGNPHLETPHLDSIGRGGVRFTQFQVSPVCSPTRSSLMTGRYNYRTGVVDTYLGRSMMHPGEVTAAEMLGGAGYRTGLFGKWHLGDNYPLRSIDQGFQESLAIGGGGLAQPADPPGSRGYFDPILRHNGKFERRKGYCTDIFASAAIEFIEANRSRPFFAYLAVNAPHDPLEVDERYVAPFRAKGVGEPAARVYGMIRNFDENVGRVLDKLRELHLDRDTIVVFLTDNGPQRERYNAGMRGLKGSVYQGGIRVPCFLRWPGVVKPGTQVDRIAAHIDLAPTLLEACGVAAPRGLRFDGRSLMPLLDGKPAKWAERGLFTQWHRGDQPEPFRNAAVRTQQYKLVDGRELYDLAADPAEKNDLAARHPDVAGELRKQYERWFADVSSTRGYAPPRIRLGTPHENPTLLSRQDWRGPRAGWTPQSLGHWEVDVTAAARYDVNVRTLPLEADATVTFRLGPVEFRQNAARGSTEALVANVALPAGAGALQVELLTGAVSSGPLWVEVRKRA